MVRHAMSGHGILKYLHLVTHKKDAPKDKDPPEGKKLPRSIWAIFIEGYTIVIMTNCQL